MGGTHLKKKSGREEKKILKLQCATYQVHKEKKLGTMYRAAYVRVCARACVRVSCALCIGERCKNLIFRAGDKER